MAVGGTIKLQGESEYKKALKEITNNLKVLSSEMKVVDAVYGKNNNSIDALSKRNEVLNETLKSQKGALNEAKKMLNEAKNSTDSNAETIAKWEIAYNKAKAEVIKTSKEIKENEEAIKELEDAVDKAEDTLKDFADTVEDTGEASDNSNEGFTVMKGALADLVANGISFAISGVKDLVSSLFELSEATEEYRIMNAKLEGSAASFGYTTEYATEKYKELYGYLGDEQMATNAITNMMGLKLSQEELTNLTESAIGVWTAYGDSIPIESLTESINETIGVGKVTGVLADALNFAGLSEDKFNEKLEKTTDEKQRAKLITETLNGAYGESKKTYDEMTKSIQETNRQEAELTETQAKLGEALEPVNNVFTELKNDVLKAITPIVTSLAEKFMDLTNWLKENETAASILAAVGVVLASAFTILAGALAIQGLITGVTKAMALLNTTLLANPIMLVVAAVAGLVAGFIYLWNNCEEFRNFWINLWNNILGILKPIIEEIKYVFEAAWQHIKAIWDFVEPYFTMIWENIKAVFSVVVDVIGGYFKMAWDNIKLVWDFVVYYFKMIWDNIKTIFNVVGDVLSGDFEGAWEGIKHIWDNVKGYFSKIWETIKGIFGNVGNFFKNSFSSAWEGIKKIFSNVGNFFGGIWNTIKSKFTSVGSKVAEAIGGAFKSAINAVIGTVEKAINRIPNAINKALSKINELPGVNIGKLPTISLPRLATGGVLKRGQVGLLEGSGAEAVVPLEKNTGWIKRVSEEMSKNVTYQPEPSNYNHESMINDFKEALKQMKIELDDEVAGQFVEDKITRLVYS